MAVVPKYCSLVAPFEEAYYDVVAFVDASYAVAGIEGAAGNYWAGGRALKASVWVVVDTRIHRCAWVLVEDIAVVVDMNYIVAQGLRSCIDLLV